MGIYMPKLNADKLLILTILGYPFLFWKDTLGHLELHVLSLLCIWLPLAAIRFTSISLSNLGIIFVIFCCAFFSVSLLNGLLHGTLIFAIKFSAILLVPLALIYLLCSTINDDSNNKRFFNNLLDFIHLLLLLNYFSGMMYGIGEIHQGIVFTRYFGIISDSFTPVLAFTTAYQLTKRSWLLYLGGTVALLSTEAKSAILYFLIMNLFYFIKLSVKKRSAMVLGVVLSIFVLAGLILGIMLLKQSAYLFDIEVFLKSVSQRLTSLSFAVDLWSQHPVMGVGINQSMEILKTADVVENYEKDFEVYKVENNYFRLLVDLGLIGFLVWVTFNVSLFFKLLGEMRGTTNFLFVNSLIFLLSYQTTAWFDIGQPQMYFFFGLLFLSQRLSTQHSSDSEPRQWR